MGYLTCHTLEAPEELIQELRDTCEEAEYAIDEDGSMYDSSKWYDHETDIKKFSANNPADLLTLRGEGENNEDMWIKYFLGGKMQKCMAKISFDPYDESKLK